MLACNKNSEDKALSPAHTNQSGLCPLPVPCLPTLLLAPGRVGDTPLPQACLLLHFLFAASGLFHSEALPCQRVAPGSCWPGRGGRRAVEGRGLGREADASWPSSGIVFSLSTPSTPWSQPSLRGAIIGVVALRQVFLSLC